MKKENLNKIQLAAYELIQSDAMFIYALTMIAKKENKIQTNYMCMSLPYIGVFTDGAEQWCKKVGLIAPTFNDEEKEFYVNLRNAHKAFSNSYNEFELCLMDKYNESDRYFFKIRRLREKIFGYYNVGVDLCEKEFCGNTILCLMYLNKPILGYNIENWLKNISIISGKIAGYFECQNYPIFDFNEQLLLIPKDYHFFKDCPIKLKNEFGFVLFSILCCINYVTQFIEQYFIGEIPQKFKFAYLQYYYLCDFLKEVNKMKGTNFYLNDSLKDRKFRNCLAHYGLGQYINEDELIENDILKGLTVKAFNMDYFEVKQILFNHLNDLTTQIKEYIF